MDYHKYKDKGLSGLANLGNTCFINSCMQILSHTYELNEFLNKEDYKKKLNNKYESLLLVEWDNLRQILWKDNVVVSPGKFVKIIQKIAHLKKMDIFTGYSQNDVSEFLLFLIDCFHSSLARNATIAISGKVETETDKIALKCFEMVRDTYSKEYSEIWNIFFAVNVSEISRIDNGKVLSIKPEPFFMVDMPIPQNNKSPTLLECFESYINGEIIEGFKDEETNEVVTIKKRILFWSFPNILAIDLKRFNNKSQKNQIHVDFPLDNLDLSPYVIGYRKDYFKYELFGVCNHSGSTMGGHYTAYVKNANGKWYHFNDTFVTEVGLTDQIISSKAYVLFYRKKN